jgi:hypothetical protein
MTTLKTAPADRKQVENLLSDLIKQFNAFSNPSHAPSQHDLEKFFTQNLVVINNEKTAAHNLNDLLTQIHELHNEFSSANYVKQQDSIILDGNKLSVRYNIDLTSKAGKKTQFQVSADLTIEDGKIAKIEQVLHEKGTNTYNPSK